MMMHRGFKQDREPMCGGDYHSCLSARLEFCDRDIVRQLESIELYEYARKLRRLKGRIETDEELSDLRKRVEKEARKRSVLMLCDYDARLAAYVRGIDDVHCHPINLGLGKGCIPKPKRSRAVSAKLRFAVLQRDGFRCVYCGATAKDTSLHVDHVRPFARGGRCEMGNLVASCSDCNLGKADRDIGALA